MTCECTERALFKRKNLDEKTFEWWEKNRHILIMKVPVSELFPEGVETICTVDSFGFRGQIFGECEECWQENIAAYNKKMGGTFD